MKSSIQRLTTLPHCIHKSSQIRLLPSIRQYSDKSPKPNERTNPFVTRPGPPPLPPDQQKEFEELVRKAQMPLSATGKGKMDVSGDVVMEVVERHPDAPKPLPAEFEGDVNPVTGERGGPKREPVKHNDWSFGGKVTDF